MLQINLKILDSLADMKIRKDDAICYLLSLYYGYSPTYIPEDLKLRLNTLRIYELDSRGGIKWNIPLFEGQEIAFNWVETEYVSLFKSANPQRGGKIRESIIRMKRLFAQNPDIRKEEVIEATTMYLNNTDSNFIRFPHYFIEKGVGIEKTYDLLDWINKLRLSKQNLIGRSGVTNTIQ